MSNNLDLLFSIEMINVHPNYETINDMKKEMGLAYGQLWHTDLLKCYSLTNSHLLTDR